MVITSMVVTGGIFLLSCLLLLGAFRHLFEGAAFSNKGTLQMRNIFVSLPMRRASATKLCHLLWNMNLAEIELSSLCLPWSLYWVGCSIEISSDICRYVCCVAQAHAQSNFWAVKIDLWQPCYSFRLHARAAFQVQQWRMLPWLYF